MSKPPKKIVVVDQNAELSATPAQQPREPAGAAARLRA
jgi:hypothetical protein